MVVYGLCSFGRAFHKISCVLERILDLFTFATLFVANNLSMFIFFQDPAAL